MTDRDAGPDESGPLVRPYVMTSGRTRTPDGTFDLISIIRSARPPAPGDQFAPESAEILRYCQVPVSVAEIAAHLDLPAGTVKVLLSDLLEIRLIHTRAPSPITMTNSEPVLEALIHGLHTL